MDLECPYCKTELEVCHDDGYGCEEGVKHQMVCNNCGLLFVFETSILFYYKTEMADCLNDGEHKWKAQSSYPKKFTKMKCETCGNRREPTRDEMKKILSETVS